MASKMIDVVMVLPRINDLRASGWAWFGHCSWAWFVGMVWAVFMTVTTMWSQTLPKPYPPTNSYVIYPGENPECPLFLYAVMIFQNLC